MPDVDTLAELGERLQALDYLTALMIVVIFGGLLFGLLIRSQRKSSSDDNRLLERQLDVMTKMQGEFNSAVEAFRASIDVQRNTAETLAATLASHDSHTREQEKVVIQAISNEGRITRESINPIIGDIHLMRMSLERLEKSVQLVVGKKGPSNEP